MIIRCEFHSYTTKQDSGTTNLSNNFIIYHSGDSNSAGISHNNISNPVCRALANTTKTVSDVIGTDILGIMNLEIIVQNNL